MIVYPEIIAEQFGAVVDGIVSALATVTFFSPTSAYDGAGAKIR